MCVTYHFHRERDNNALYTWIYVSNRKPKKIKTKNKEHDLCPNIAYIQKRKIVYIIPLYLF